VLVDERDTLDTKRIVSKQSLWIFAVSNAVFVFGFFKTYLVLTIYTAYILLKIRYFR